MEEVEQPKAGKYGWISLGLVLAVILFSLLAFIIAYVFASAGMELSKGIFLIIIFIDICISLLGLVFGILSIIKAIKEQGSKVKGIIGIILNLLLAAFFVLLFLFLLSLPGGSDRTEHITSQIFSQSQIDIVKQECQNLCDGIKDVYDAVEYCRRNYMIDWNGDNIGGQKIEEGRWQFCEDKIPCFVMTECPKFNITTCAQILKEYNPDQYNMIFNDGPTGSCGLDPNSPNNWYVKANASGQ